MDIILYVIAGLLLFVGFIGCFLPVIPGPPLSYIGLLLLQLTTEAPFTSGFMITLLLITLSVQVLDYVIPIFGAKKYGGSRAGVVGSMVGLVVGMLLFPPIGIVIGPMAGALVGELMMGRKYIEAWRSAWGSLIGFLAGTVIKLAVSSVMFYYYFEAIIISLG